MSRELFEEQRTDLIEIVNNMMHNYDFATAIIKNEKTELNGYRDSFNIWCSTHYLDFNKIGIAQICSGCTKICVIPIDLDYVIKVDIDLSQIETYNSAVRAYNYCAREYANYVCAVDNHIEKFFAETYELCTVDGFHFFAQEKCACNEGDVEEALYESVSNSFDDSCINEDTTNYSEEDLEDLRNSYIWDQIGDLYDEERFHCLFNGDDRIDDLEHFIEMRSIDDLHNGNFGRTERGFVIIDFSGYSRVWDN